MDPEQSRVAELSKLIETTNVLKKVVDLTQASTTIIPSDAKEGDLRVIFVEATKHVHNTVTKFYLGTGEATTGAQVKDFVELMDKSITNLIYAGYALMVHPTTVINLKKYLSAVMTNTLDALAQLTTAIIKKEKQNNNLPTLTGLVWHYCTAIEEGKLSNIAFTSEVIKKNSTTMQDAISELKEILEAANEANNNKEDDDDDSDGSDDGFDDFFGGDEKLSEAERALVNELVRLTNLCHGFAGNIARVLGISVDLLESSSGPWLEDLAVQVNELTAHVDEVIMAAQPPIAKAGMQRAVDELIAGINKVVETIRTSPLTSPVSGEDIGSKSKKLVDVSLNMSSALHKTINELINALKDEDDD